MVLPITQILANAPWLAVLSYVQGRSGKLSQNDYATSKGAEWGMFDAGIACQSFVLHLMQKASAL